MATVLLLLPIVGYWFNATQTEAQAVVVTRNNATLPEGCSPDEVAQLIIGYLDAYNSGDQEQITNFFPATFEWYSDAVVVNGVEVDQDHYFLTRPGSRNDLLNYAAERRQQDDRLQLIAVNVSGPGWDGGAGFSFRLTRTADDVKQEPNGQVRYVEGNGNIRCRTQKFWVWSLATRSPDFLESDLFYICPEPPPGTPKDVVIACSRN